MANRAYLFCRDDPDDFTSPKEGEPYYDSRHVIPLSWFCFYSPFDIVQHSVGCRGSRWVELKFAAVKTSALDRFRRRIPLVRAATEDAIGVQQLEEFANTLAKRHGQYLLLDPEEIFSGIGSDPEEDMPRISALLQSLSYGNAVAFRELVAPYWSLIEDERYDIQLQVIGATYS